MPEGRARPVVGDDSFEGGGVGAPRVAENHDQPVERPQLAEPRAALEHVDGHLGGLGDVLGVAVVEAHGGLSRRVSWERVDGVLFVGQSEFKIASASR